MALRCRSRVVPSSSAVGGISAIRSDPPDRQVVTQNCRSDELNRASASLRFVFELLPLGDELFGGLRRCVDVMLVPMNECERHRSFHQQHDIARPSRRSRYTRALQPFCKPSLRRSLRPARNSARRMAGQVCKLDYQTGEPRSRPSWRAARPAGQLSKEGIDQPIGIGRQPSRNTLQALGRQVAVLLVRGRVPTDCSGAILSLSRCNNTRHRLQQ
jgi:hypothetical protein